jgi:hypothetical protein
MTHRGSEYCNTVTVSAPLRLDSWHYDLGFRTSDRILIFFHDTADTASNYLVGLLMDVAIPLLRALVSPDDAILDACAREGEARSG